MALRSAQWIRTVPLAGILLAAPCSIAAQSDSREQCEPSLAQSAAPGRLGPGVYRITFVATKGSRLGAVVSGELVLESSRAADGRRWSPSAGSASDTSEHPLIGYTSVDLRAVGAPIAPAGDALHPAPDSRNATFPGVLALTAPSEPGKVKLLIGTLSNRRDGTMMDDGGGIVLELDEFSPTRILGSWGAWGIVANGSGRFCAVRTAEVAPARPNGGW